MSGTQLLFEVNFTTSLGPIKGKVAVADGPMRLADLVPTACELTHVLVALAKKKTAAEGKPCTCGPGCGSCCSQMVPLSPPEAFCLADILDAMDAERQSRYRDRFNAIRLKLEAESLLAPLFAEDYSDEIAMAAAKAYFYLGMPCPFLEAGSCSIYTARPVACREYNVTSPPEWCRDPFRNPVAKIPLPKPLSAHLSLLTADLTETRPRLIPLALAPFWAEENKRLRGREWPGKDLFSHFMKVIQEQGDGADA